MTLIPVCFSSLIPRMSTFILAISCLTTSNLPWFMDLTFQVPMQYCSLHGRTLLLSPVTSTAGYWFCFCSIPSFFLELVLHLPPVAYWAPTNLFQCPIILPFHTVHGVLKARIRKWFAVPSPVDRILSDLSTMTRLTLNRSFIFRIMSRERVTLGISLTVMVSLSQRPLANLFSVSWVTCHL